MADTERVQIVKRGGNLMSYGLGSMLSYCELTLLHIGKQVSTREVLHDYVDIIFVLEYI